MLRIYIGPMYAGKTTLLMNMFVENPSDKKEIYDFEMGVKCYKGVLHNHDVRTLPALKCEHLYDTKDVYAQRGNVGLAHDSLSVYDPHPDPVKHPEMFPWANRFADHIYINEAQFFPDLQAFVLDALKQHKHVYIYGLDGDFQQKKMGQVLDLIPHCHEVVKLSSICAKCGERAIYSKRLTDSNVQYLPDETAYLPLCRLCFDII